MGQRNIKQVELTKKQTRAFELVSEGKTFQQAAEVLGVSRSTAFAYFQKAISELKVDESKIQEWRILLSHRLDKMLRPLMEVITDPKSKPKHVAECVRAAIRIEDRRAKMLGIDKPSKLDITHHIPALDPEEAVKRQRQRLKEEGFIRMNTRPPIALIESKVAEVVDVEPDDDK